MESSAVVDYGTTRNELRQLRRQWHPVGRPRAVVLIVHGIAEHCGRYAQVAAQMTAAGLGVVAYDQRGHGETEGRKVFVNKFSELVDDVEDHLGQLRGVGVPVVLLGHSMGGLVATTYAVSDRPQPDLLVLSGPALAPPVPAWQVTAAHKLAQLSPRIHLKPPFDTAILSRDPAVGAAYDADPLIKGGSTVGLISQMFEAMEATGAAIDRLRIPTLCLHGAADELVPATASAILEGLPGVERRLIPDLRHEIFNEPEGPGLVADVLSWVDAQLAGLA